jgi:hypothetical protein
MTTCLRIPPGVQFERWQGETEWVLYHSGTGATVRLSDAAVAVLDLLEAGGALDEASLARRLNQLMDSPLTEDKMAAALVPLVRDLLGHECVERVPCA